MRPRFFKLHCTYVTSNPRSQFSKINITTTTTTTTITTTTTTTTTNNNNTATGFHRVAVVILRVHKYVISN